MYPKQTGGGKTVGGLEGNISVSSSLTSATRPMSELESEFNKLNQASEYLSSRISLLENRLSPVLMAPMPENSNEKDIEPQTTIGKTIRSHKEAVDAYIHRIDSMINRLSL